LELGINRIREAEPHREQIGYRVDDLIVDVRRQHVARGRERINLSPLSYELLLALLQAAPHLVSLDELMKRVWPGLVVSPETVSQRVKLVRHALGDRAGSPRYIGGVRGRGYQLIADVEPLTAVDAPRLNGAAAAPPLPPSTEAETPAMPPSGEAAPAASPRSQAAKTSPARRPRVRRVARRVVYAMLALLAAAFLYRAGDLPLRAWWAAGSPAAAEIGANSLAVLPFVNLSGDPASEYLSEGLSEEILNRLSRARGVRVASRTSSFAYRDSDVDARRLQDLLGVRYLLEGSVRREGPHLRVTVQLVDESGFRVWSGTYDRRLTGMFALQDDIAGSVVTSVLPRLTAEDEAVPRIEATRGALRASPSARAGLNSVPPLLTPVARVTSVTGAPDAIAKGGGAR
jgi:TolB-like protein/DNA-binding winged helix-turn-helix (wHTH) protein